MRRVSEAMISRSVVGPVACFATVLAVLMVPAGGHTAWAANARAVSSSTFYATTKQAYDSWSKTSYAPPARVDTFPTGTTTVAFYFTYAGAESSSGYYVVMRKHRGASVAVAGRYSLTAGSSSRMLYLKHSSGPFPDGDYDADLVIDHQRLATISLTVGSSGVVGKVNGVTITAFLSATSRDGAQWFKGSNHRQLWLAPATSARQPLNSGSSLPTKGLRQTSRPRR